MWNRLLPPVQTHLPALIWPHCAVFQISVPHHIYVVPPTPFLEPVSCYIALRKLGPVFCPTMSGSCFWPSPDFFNKCPSLPCYSHSPLSSFWDFCLPHVPVSSIPEVVCLTTIHHLQSQCHCTAHSYTVTCSLILCLFGLYMLYV